MFLLLHLKRQSEHSGLRPDTSSLVNFCRNLSAWKLEIWPCSGISYGSSDYLFMMLKAKPTLNKTYLFVVNYPALQH